MDATLPNQCQTQCAFSTVSNKRSQCQTSVKQCQKVLTVIPPIATPLNSDFLDLFSFEAKKYSPPQAPKNSQYNCSIHPEIPKKYLASRLQRTPLYQLSSQASLSPCGTSCVFSRRCHWSRSVDGVVVQMLSSQLAKPSGTRLATLRQMRKTESMIPFDKIK